jgi:hypothetical protein
MRLRLAIAVLLLASCTKKSLIPCTEQATCDPYGAVCLDGFCHNPGEEMLDLAVADLAMPEPDLTVTCVDSSECTNATTPICDPTSHVCRACADDCSMTAHGGLCAKSGPFLGACVECLAESDCSASRGYCDATAHCAKCASGYQCQSGACGMLGCELEADVLYIDNTKACVAPTGTRAKPYCTINDAITNAPAGKEFLVLIGSSTPYAGVSYAAGGPSRTFRIIGPGLAASPRATIGPINPAMSASIIGLGSSCPTSLFFEGVDFVGQAGTTGDVLLLAGGTGSLYLADSRVSNTTGKAVASYGGNVSLVRVEVSNAETAVDTGNFAGTSIALKGCYLHDNGDGVRAVYGSYTVENSLFVHNQHGAVNFSSNAAGVFRFNTLVDNSYAFSDYTLLCAGATPVVSSSIVVANKSISGTQIAGCTLDNVVTGTDSHAGAIQLIPAFVGATDYRLKKGDAANTACCVDKAATGPTLDKDGLPRPLGAGFDIGAYEAE